MPLPSLLMIVIFIEILMQIFSECHRGPGKMAGFVNRNKPDNPVLQQNERFEAPDEQRAN